MKRISLIIVILALGVPTTALSEVPQFVLSSEASGSSCVLVDNDPGVVEVHMLIQNADNVLAVQYAAPLPDCWMGATWIDDDMAFPVTIGDTQLNDPRGMSVGLGACLSSPIYLGSMRFQTSGAGVTCCEFQVVKALVDGYEEIPGPIMAICTDPADITADTIKVAGFSAGAIINAQTECACSSVLANRQSTWGAVKQLYR